MDFFFFLLFPRNSHQVPHIPNVFSNMFLRAPHFYPEAFSLLLWTIQSFGFIFLVFVFVRPIKMARCKGKKKKVEGRRHTPNLI